MIRKSGHRFSGKITLYNGLKRDSDSISGYRASADPVAVELLDNVGVHGLGIGYIQIAFGNRADALLGKAPSIQGRGQPRIDSQRRIEIGNGVFRQATLEVNKATAVQCVDKIWSQPKRFVAILQRRRQVADDRAGPATVVEGLHVLRVQPERVIEILDGKAVGPLAGIDLSTTVKRVGVVRIGIELGCQALDGWVIGE